MRIIHFCESISYGGGIASLVSNLVTEQSKDNDITIGVINQSTTNEVYFDANVNIRHFNKKRLGFSIKYPLYIFAFLLRNKFDIVHIHSAFLYFALSVILLRWRTKFVYTVHSDAQMENSSVWDKRFLWLKKYCFTHRYIYPITISPVSKQSFDDLYKMDSHMIENGIRKPVSSNMTNKLNEYRYTNNTKLFLHPGRISMAKNQIVLCKVFNRLIAEGHDVVLLIAGVIQDQTIYNEIKKYLSDRIVYLGERKDVIDLLRESDAMCLSSIWEGLPITLLEALSVGCTPICTPVGGIPNVITNNQSGILSLSSSEYDYYKAILYYLDLPEDKRKAISSSAKARFNDYDIKKTARRYMDYYMYIKRC